MVFLKNQNHSNFLVSKYLIKNKGEEILPSPYLLYSKRAFYRLSLIQNNGFLEVP